MPLGPTTMLAATAAFAQTTTWFTNGDGDWTDGGNWDTGERSGNSFNAIIDDGDSGVTVTLNTSRTSNDLSIGADDELFFSNGANLNIEGDVTNNGIISLNSLGSFTNFTHSGASPDLVLSGNGTLQLGAGTTNIVTGSGTLTNSAAHTISGGGNHGFNAIGINNLGLIDANLAATTMRVNPSSALGLSNAGTMQASNGGVLRLDGSSSGDFNNAGGIIQALDGSEVQLTDSASITDGTLTTSGSGVIRVGASQSASLSNLTNTGTLTKNNPGDLDISGTIKNTGSITIASAGSFTELEVLAGGATLTGGGTVTLDGGSDKARLTAGSIGVRLTNTDNTIQGEGQLGANGVAFTNQVAGLIDANINGGVLAIDPVGTPTDLGLSFLNQGILQASNGGILVLSGNASGDFTNSGATIQALDNSEVQLTNNASITGGTLTSNMPLTHLVNN